MIAVPPNLAERYRRLSDRTGRLAESLMLEALERYLLVLDWQQRRVEDKQAKESV